MQKRLSYALLLISILCSISAINGYAQAITFQAWQIEDGGGHYSESNGLIRLWTDEGWIVFYKEYTPKTDFKASVEVKATVMKGFALMLRGSLPFAGSIHGVNLEFSERNGLTFHFAKMNGGWGWSSSGTAQPDVWYRLVLNVHKSPYSIAAEVYNKTGFLLYSVTTSAMTNLDFDDIRYVGFGVLEPEGDFTVQNASVNPEPEPPTTPEPPLGIALLAAGLILIAIAIGIHLKPPKTHKTNRQTPLTQLLQIVAATSKRHANHVATSRKPTFTRTHKHHKQTQKQHTEHETAPQKQTKNHDSHTEKIFQTHTNPTQPSS